MLWLVFLIYPLLAVIGWLGIMLENALLVVLSVGAIAVLGPVHWYWSLSRGRLNRQSE